MVERWKCICPPLYNVYHERVTCAMNALHAVITVRRSLTATSFALRTSSSILQWLRTQYDQRGRYRNGAESGNPRDVMIVAGISVWEATSSVCNKYQLQLQNRQTREIAAFTCTRTESTPEYMILFKENPDRITASHTVRSEKRENGKYMWRTRYLCILHTAGSLIAATILDPYTPHASRITSLVFSSTPSHIKSGLE